MWIALRLTAAERAVLGELLRIGPYTGLDDVVCAGLYQLAKQLDVPVTTFALGRGKP